MRFSLTLPQALSSLLLLASLTARAEPIAVRYRQGATHGFVLVRTEAGKLLGYGDFIQIPHGDRITSRFVLHLKDGSVDEETTVYVQGPTLRFFSDRHIQRGPFFSKPLDMTVAQDGTITCRTRQTDGTVKTESSHIDLPPDISNGMIAIELLNVQPDAPTFKLGYIAPYGKGRLIQLGISPSEKQSFSCVAGFPCKATVFRIKPEIGGIAGMVAPLIGKQPPDLFVWVHQGEIPAIVRKVGQLAIDGPIVSIEIGGAIFSHPKTEAH